MAAHVKLLLSTYACDPEEGSEAAGAEAMTWSALGPHGTGNCWFSVGTSGHGWYAEPKVIPEGAGPVKPSRLVEGVVRWPRLGVERAGSRRPGQGATAGRLRSRGCLDADAAWSGLVDAEEGAG